MEKCKGMLWLGEEYFSGDGIAAIRGRISSSLRAVLQDGQPLDPTCPRRFPPPSRHYPNAAQPIDGVFLSRGSLRLISSKQRP